jgi:hypothetical protein
LVPSNKAIQPNAKGESSSIQQTPLGEIGHGSFDLEEGHSKIGCSEELLSLFFCVPFGRRYSSVGSAFFQE